MIDRRTLVGALEVSRLADWVIVERRREIGSVDERTRLRRTEARQLWTLTVHHDSPAGRGSAHITVDAVDENAEAVVDQVAALARASIGPTWLSRPLAAPARVRVEDPALAKREPLDAASELVKRLVRPTEVVATATITRDHVYLDTRAGLHAEWTETLYRAELLAIAGARSVVLSRDARHRDGLDLSAALVNASEDLKLLARAGAPVAGKCSIVLASEALLHDGIGVWAAFVSQADAVIERQGLTRYRERAPIMPGADQISEPLTIASDGALDFGVHSVPIGDEGDAVRRFPLVERGVAAGLGLSPREAALRGRDANGGVRNLVVEAGSWSGTIDASMGRVVEVRRLRSLSIDPYTGEASLEIALAVDHSKAGTRPFAGGSLRIDLIAALARAKRTAAVLTRGAYKGPQAVLVERAELIA